MSTQERWTIQVGNIKIRLQGRTNHTTTTPKKAIQESLATKPSSPELRLAFINCLLHRKPPQNL